MAVGHAIEAAPTGRVLLTAFRMAAGCSSACLNDCAVLPREAAETALRSATEIVAFHGGSLEVDSRAGQGMTTASGCRDAHRPSLPGAGGLGAGTGSSRQAQPAPAPVPAPARQAPAAPEQAPAPAGPRSSRRSRPGSSAAEDAAGALRNMPQRLWLRDGFRATPHGQQMQSGGRHPLSFRRAADPAFGRRRRRGERRRPSDGGRC